MPGAANVGFIDYLNDGNLSPWIPEGLFSIAEEAVGTYGKEFLELSGSEQKQLIDKLRRKLFRFFSHLTAYVLQFYYQNDGVLEAIGLEARPPFPQGYILEDGDLMLLEPVYERGKIYRD